MSCSFDSFGDFSLMAGAGASFFSGFDFSQAGNKPSEKAGVFKIDFLNIALAQITSHSLNKFQVIIFRTGYLLR